jgi:hypothetical protein
MGNIVTEDGKYIITEDGAYVVTEGGEYLKTPIISFKTTASSLKYKVKLRD